MDGPVVAALISSSVAVFVAVAGAIRADVQRASDRRYERRRVFLIDAQDAALALRDALRVHGEALQRTARRRAPALDPGMSDLEIAVAAAEGRLAVAGSRVEDAGVVELLVLWQRAARAKLIDVDEQAPDEEAAFAELNEHISAALRSMRGRAPR